MPHRHQLLPPAAQMDDASWDKLFTTATLTDYQAEDVVRALPGPPLSPKGQLWRREEEGPGVRPRGICLAVCQTRCIDSAATLTHN